MIQPQLRKIFLSCDTTVNIYTYDHPYLMIRLPNVGGSFKVCAKIYSYGWLI